VHFFLTAASYRSAQLDEAGSIAEVCRLVGEQAAKIPPGEWVYGFNCPAWTIGRLPTMDELDAVSGDHPVYVASDSFHSGAANSKAIALLAPPERLRGVEKDPETGEPTGRFLTDEAHFWAAGRAYGALPDEHIQGLFLGAADHAVTKGVTTLHCLDGQFVANDRDIKVLLGLDDRLPLHTLLMYQTMDVERVVELGLPRIGGCLTIDGAGPERTALFYEPYAGAPGVYGDLYIPEERVRSFVMEAHVAGLQIGMHAIGDRAIDILVNAYQEAMESSPRDDRRHRVEHFYVPTDWAIDRARELGLALTMQPAFSWTCDLPGESLYEGLWGAQRANRAEPFPRLCSMGIVVSGGSDSPISAIDPLLGIHSAVNNPNPVRRVSVDDALRMFTINGAWVGHEERERGSLTVGKVADIVVLDQDPYLQADSIKDFEIALTICAGEVRNALL
jgi:predicted amidohydrolase YtcJ